mmetsp:Transcript_43672/g.105339  ORF Transcript_43672/g.105339 Transcript_43672/m.105339 type:complete len:336 (+) Transcript_43672:24-1031(+)
MMRVTRFRRLIGSTATIGFILASQLCAPRPCAAFVHRPQEGGLRMASSSLHADVETVVVAEQLLPFEKSSHNSATIVIPDDEDKTYDKSTFKQKLEETVSALRVMEKRSVWVQVPMSRGSLLEDMVDLGFEFHNAQGNTAKLNLWLPTDRESKVPEFATHHVGVGAVVVNSRDEILCVRELRKNYMPWKVPGGLADLGEHIPDAAQREVMEETGIPTKFNSILSFRHTHGLSNGRSDMYFVCHLDPIEDVDEDGNVVIPEPQAQVCEIETTKWVPLSEYRDMINGVSHETGHPMMRQVMKVFEEGKRIQQKEVTSVVPGRKPNPVYLPADVSKAD